MTNDLLTNYTIRKDGQTIQTNDCELAASWSRAGARVTAFTVSV